jgi:hypothetical protein
MKTTIAVTLIIENQYSMAPKKDTAIRFTPSTTAEKMTTTGTHSGRCGHQYCV